MMDSPAKEKTIINSPNEKIADSTPKETSLVTESPKVSRPYRQSQSSPGKERLSSTRLLRSQTKDENTPSIGKEESCELFIEPSPKRGRPRSKRASSIGGSTVTEPEVKDVGVGTSTTDDGSCSQIGPQCNIDAGLANKSVRQEPKQLISEPSHLYEVDEDKTIPTMASKEDWAARRTRNRPSKYTKRTIMGKAIEYGIVAGVAVAIFAFVTRRYQ